MLAPIRRCRAGSSARPLAALLLLAGFASAQAEPPRGFARREVQVLGNPALELLAPTDRELSAQRRQLPYWKLLNGTTRPWLDGAKSPGEWAALLDPSAPRVVGLWLEGGAQIAQSAAAYAPFAAELSIRVRLSGRARIEVIDGNGRRFARDFDQAGEPETAVIRGAELVAAFGAPVLPRLQLRISGAGARIEEVELFVPLPAPDEAELLAEIESELGWFIATWSERALDTLGERKTAFAARDFDAVSGAPLAVLARSPVLDSFWQQLLDAWEADPRPEWSALLERYLADLFELGLQPGNGLPRAWDPERDVPVDDLTLEIHAHLRFLCELAERGPQAFRARAREAALKIGELVLALGVLPDGAVAAAYRSSDGRPSTDTVPIRRLDLPAMLARLGALSGDERYVSAARDALFALEFAHHWPGTWDRIDPGFDDNFGHYGERAAAAAHALPAEHSFHAFALSGHARYAPLLALALRFGGNVAADQVRCWRIFRELGELVPALREPNRALIVEAARNHFRGQQGASGAWLDLTMQGFDPVALPVGDTGGVPQNLLAGLAHAYEREPDAHAAELRAMFTAVMLSTRAQYRAEYGYVSGARRNEGRGAANSASATLRYTSGLVAMLRRLKGLD